MEEAGKGVEARCGLRAGSQSCVTDYLTEQGESDEEKLEAKGGCGAVSRMH